MSLPYALQDLTRAANAMETAEIESDWPEAMIEWGKAARALAKIGGALIEHGIRDGMTQRNVARCMGVPESWPRGARAEATTWKGWIFGFLTAAGCAAVLFEAFVR